MAGVEQPKKRQPHEAAGWVAVILAVGISLALNVVTIALLWAASHRLGIDPDSGISDNGVQLLLAWGGGIISVLAGYTGYVIGKKTGQNEILPGAKPPDPPTKPPPKPPP